MPQPSIASRRFYNAFYKWATLTSTHQKCIRTLQQSTPQWLQTQTRPAQSSRDNDDTRARRRRPMIQKHTSAGRKTKEEEQDEDLSWLDAEVKTSSERPFDTLEPWDEVLRYKSFAGVMIQMAIPTAVIDEIERQHGPMKDMEGAPGVRTEVGTSFSKKTKAGNSVDVKSVLASGTFNEITKLRNLIRSHHQIAHAEQGTKLNGSSAPQADRAVASHSVVPPRIPERATAAATDNRFTGPRLRYSNRDPNAQIQNPRHNLDRNVTLVFIPRLGDNLIIWDNVMSELPKLPVYIDKSMNFQAIAKMHTVVLEGSQDTIDRATARIQSIVDRVCKKHGVPTVLIQQNARLGSGSERENSADTVTSDAESGSHSRQRTPGLTSQASVPDSSFEPKGQTGATRHARPEHISILSIPDPDGNKAIWDDFMLGAQSISKCQMGGIRDMGICVLAGEKDDCEAQKKQIQTQIDIRCEHHGLPRAALVTLHSNDSTPLDSDESNPDPKFNRYSIKLAVPDHVDASIKEKILAYTVGRGGIAVRNFCKQLGCFMQVVREECAFEIRGPVMAVVDAAKKLQSNVNRVFRSHDLEPEKLNVVRSLMPECGPFEGQKHLRSVREIEDDSGRVDVRQNPTENEEYSTAVVAASRQSAAQSMEASDTVFEDQYGGALTEEESAPAFGLRATSAESTSGLADIPGEDVDLGRTNIVDKDHQRSQSLESTQRRTSIISIPDPGGKRTVWDQFWLQYGPNLKIASGGLREMGLLVLVGSRHIVEEEKREVQLLIDDICKENAQTQVSIQTLNDTDVSIARTMQIHKHPAQLDEFERTVEPLNLSRHGSGTDSYYIKIGLPDDIAQVHRDNMIAYTNGKGGEAKADLERRTGCAVQISKDECSYAIQGPVMGVVQSVKNLQTTMNKLCRLKGIPQSSFTQLVPLGPIAERTGATNESKMEESANVTSRSETSRQNGMSADTNSAPIDQSFEPHYLKVALPSHPDPDKSLASHLRGGKGSSLARIAADTGCYIRSSQAGTVLEFEGSKTAITNARDAVQRVIFDACNIDQVRQVWLNDLEPLTSTAEFEGKKQTQRSEDLKAALRTLTHPVVLVTSAIRERTKHAPKFENCRGVTVSSFTAITLAPKPIISYNIKVPSRSWDAMLDSQRLCVHMLSASPQGAAIAHAFTQPYEEPSEPFERLEKLGASVYVETRDRATRGKPPTVDWQGVVCHVEARLMKEKCVEVGDHIVVVAEVTGVHFGKTIDVTPDGDKLDGLAYARRGYRSIGPDVVPVDIPSLEDALNDGGKDSKAPAETSVNDVNVIDSCLEEDRVAQSGVSNDTSNGTTNVKDFPTTVNDTDAISREDETEYRALPNTKQELGSSHDLNASSGQSNVTTDQSTTSSNLEGGEEVMAKYFQQAQDEDLKDDSSPEVSHSASTLGGSPHHSYGAPNRGSRLAWGVEPTFKSSFSTYAKSVSRMRPYFTTMASDELSASSTTSRTLPDSQVADPAILNTTVGDFLGVSDDYVRPPRMREIVRAKQQAEDASLRLEQALADGTLTAEESARLEDLIARNERRVAKKLAFRSADDLRRMLDKGRVDDRRASWLESSIEKGQAVLIEEAKQLRNLLERGIIGTERFRIVRERLEQQNQTLSTEVMRLRQMVDEDGDLSDEVQEDGPSFDGFQGNIQDQVKQAGTR